jgi:hypothetical protein
LKNYPESLKVVPNVLNKDVSFKEILEYIYDKFRSPYLHEALPSIDKLEKKEFVTVIQNRLLISREKKLIALELEEFFEWFSHVVKESLCRDFIS